MTTDRRRGRRGVPTPGRCEWMYEKCCVRAAEQGFGKAAAKTVVPRNLARSYVLGSGK